MDTIYFSSVSASQFLAQRLEELVRDERSQLVEFLQHLGEFDKRKLYLEAAFSSLYAYCVEHLRLSNGAAYRRITAARLLARFPAIAPYLEDGRLNLKRLCLLKDVLTEENCEVLLHQASLGTELHVQALAASLTPKEEVKDSIRKVRRSEAVSTPPVEVTFTGESARPNSPGLEAPAPKHGGADVLPQTATGEPLFAALPPTQPMLDAGPRSEAAITFTSESKNSSVARPAPVEVKAINGERYSLKMNVGKEFLAELEEVKAALGHKVPNGKLEDVLRECFRLTLEAVAKRRTGSAKKKANASAPRTKKHSRRESTSDVTPLQGGAMAVAQSASEKVLSPSSSESAPSSFEEIPAGAATSSRYLPVELRRAVWSRDEGRCAFIGASGKRCNSKHRLEFHHIIPFAHGGEASLENLSLRCRSHNDYEAVLDFGEDFMAKARASQSEHAAPH